MELCRFTHRIWRKACCAAAHSDDGNAGSGGMDRFSIPFPADTLRIALLGRRLREQLPRDTVHTWDSRPELGRNSWRTFDNVGLALAVVSLRLYLVRTSPTGIILCFHPGFEAALRIGLGSFHKQHQSPHLRSCHLDIPCA
ncbi:uncharacterized protein CLUP02_15958 [Colletotrichum lupini]|uniref:Uncharacterized protein n=1 Tax=Colletotrichum lupini TaxID=145971 RepID=A0A9Q8WNS0_9PEZI|nr:uncharacterized protein CLUP02_15958 [Colletotrichum lupini]UQC90428.1 hypothetical protein CLUP02_15958 [Colletotrichum lupini]